MYPLGCDWLPLGLHRHMFAIKCSPVKSNDIMESPVLYRIVLRVESWGEGVGLCVMWTNLSSALRDPLDIVCQMLSWWTK